MGVPFCPDKKWKAEQIEKSTIFLWAKYCHKIHWQMTTEIHYLQNRNPGAEISVGAGAGYENMNCSWWIAGGSVWPHLREKSLGTQSLVEPHTPVSLTFWNSTRFSQWRSEKHPLLLLETRSYLERQQGTPFSLRRPALRRSYLTRS